MKKLLIILLSLIAVTLLADSVNDEVEALYKQAEAYYKASKNKSYSVKERNKAKKKVKNIKQYVDDNYEAVPIDIKQDMQAKDSCIDDETMKLLKSLNMFKNEDKKKLNKIKEE